MNIVLCDVNRQSLLPFTFTRPVAEIRTGIFTFRERWERWMDCSTSTLTEGYLQNKFPLKKEQDNILINSSIVANENLREAILKLKTAQQLVSGNKILAANVSMSDFNFSQLPDVFKNFEAIQYPDPVIEIKNCWDIFSKNDKILKQDFDFLVKGRESKQIDSSNQVKSDKNIFIEEGAAVTCSILNADNGPIYIGKEAEVMEGCMIRGPFVLGEHSTLKMGAKIYGATTIGPHCKVGGEVNNSVIFGYSNKAHDGFLGNSVLGEWCNLGADTNNSNLKNNYGIVKIYDYGLKDYIETGLQFCGLMMGDHSKAGINTMFNTGTVVGVCANIFGGGFPDKFIPSFTWGGFKDSEIFNIDKAIAVSKEVYKRRNMEFGADDTGILKHLYSENKN